MRSDRQHAEHQALLAAERRFMELQRDRSAGAWKAPADRKVMNDLARAARTMRGVLDNFTLYDEANRRQLFTEIRARLIDEKILRTSEDVDEAFDTLKQNLEFIAGAAEAVAGAERGRHADVQAWAWIRMGAEEWLLQLGEEPEATGDGFPKALQDFAAERLHLPTVGAKLIEQVVKHWQKMRIEPPPP
ncbi:MAG TPA: hypothetical protein VGI48_09505 [Caldimonas sp.]|jgi:hypothetical protein